MYYGVHCVRRTSYQLSQKRKQQQKLKKIEILIIIPIGNIDDGQYLVKFSKYNVRYENSHARICPFLLAKGREMISKLIQPNQEFIIRSHTDSMISTKKLDIETGDELGDLKYYGHCENLKIVNNLKIIGEFLDFVLPEKKCMPF